MACRATGWMGFGAGICVLLGTLVATGTDAHAMAARTPASAEKGGAKSPPSSVVEAQGSALQKAWAQVEGSLLGDLSGLDAATKGFETVLAEAQKAESEAAFVLGSIEADRAREQESLDSLNSRIRELERIFVSGTLAATDRDKRLKELETQRDPANSRIEELRRQAAFVRGELLRGQELLAKLREQAQAGARKLGEQELEFKTGTPEETKVSFTRFRDSIERERKRDWLERGLVELGERLKRDSLRSEFLLTESGILRRQQVQSSERLDALRRMVEHRLDDSVIGNYIQIQVRKALGRAAVKQPETSAAIHSPDSTASGEAAGPELWAYGARGH